MPTTTALGDYDIVLAVTEDALNSAMKFSSIWSQPITAYPPTAPGAPPPTDSSPGLHSVTMSQPQIVLTGDNVGDNQVGMVLSFTGGTVVYFSYYYNSIVSQDLAGWVMQFSAPLSQTVVSDADDPSTLPVAVQQALSSDILSVEQLFLQTSAATWTNALITDDTGATVDDSGITTTIIDSFQSYIDATEEADVNQVITYLIGSTDPQSDSGVLPDFVPTSYNYSTSKYQPANDGYDGLSTLNYLIMTNLRPAPTSGTAGNFDQNWVPAPNTQGYGGTVAIDGQLFNSSYLEAIVLPVIQQAIPFSNAFTSNTNNHLAPWSDSQTSTSSPVLVGHTLTHDVTVYQTTENTTSCTVSESTSAAKLLVSGSFYSKCSFDCHFFGQSIGGYYQTFTQPWSFSITMTATDNGTVSLSATDFVMNTDDMVASDVEAVDNGNWIQNIMSEILAPIEGFLSGFLDTYTSGTQDEFSENIESIDFTTVSSQIDQSLQSVSGSIVFPGGQTYSYQNLSFSQDGEQDLLGSVMYLS